MRWILIVLIIGGFMLSTTLNTEPVKGYDEYTSSSEVHCIGVTCTKTLYSATMFIEESKGWKTLPEIVNTQWESGGFNISYKDQYWVIIEPFVRTNSGSDYNVSEIKDLFPAVGDLWKYVTTNRFNRKWGIEFTGIPQELINNIQYLGFRVLQSNGITLADIELDTNKKVVKIKDKFEINYADLIENQYIVQLENKTTVLIGNISENYNTTTQNIILDPTVQLQDADSEVLDDSYFSETGSPSGSESTITFEDTMSGSGDIPWFKFNMSSLINAEKINDVSLCLFITSIDGIDLYAVNSTPYSLGWDEATLDSDNTLTTITNNMTTLLQSVDSSGSQGEQICINGTNITNYLTYEVINQGNVNLTFGLNKTTSSRSSIWSKENSDTTRRPYLVVVYDYTQEGTDFFDNFNDNDINDTLWINYTSEDAGLVGNEQNNVFELNRKSAGGGTKGVGLLTQYAFNRSDNYSIKFLYQDNGYSGTKAGFDGFWITPLGVVHETNNYYFPSENTLRVHIGRRGCSSEGAGYTEEDSIGVRFDSDKEWSATCPYETDYGENNTLDQDSATDITDGNWHQVEILFNGTIGWMEVYINNTKVLNTIDISDSNLTAIGDFFRMAWHQSGYPYLTGDEAFYIDDVNITILNKPSIINGPPFWQTNTTNTTTQGADILFSLNWSDYDGQDLSGYIFSLNNGTNYTSIDWSNDIESGDQNFYGEGNAPSESSEDCGANCNWCNEDDNTDDCESAQSSSHANCGTAGTDGFFWSENIWVNGSYSPGGSITITARLDSNYIGSYLVTGWQDGIHMDDFGCYDNTDNYCSGYTTLDFADNKCNLTFGSGYSGSETASFNANTSISSSANTDSDYHFRVSFIYNTQCDVTGAGDGYQETDGDWCEERNYGENDGINITLTAGTSDIEINKTAVEYDNIAGTFQEQINNITIRVFVSKYNASGSVTSANNNITLWLNISDGTNEYGYDFEANETEGNFSITITNSNVVNNWSSDTLNRDFNITAIYVDYDSAGVFDNISWNDVFVVINSEEYFTDYEWTQFTGVSNHSNVTNTLPDVAGQLIQWYIAANDTLNEWNTSDIFEFETISGNQYPNWSNNMTNTTEAGEWTNFSVYWQDDGTLDSFVFLFDNGSGSFINDTPQDLTGSISWVNVTKFVNITQGATIRWQVFVNDTTGLMNHTDIFEYDTIRTRITCFDYNNILSDIHVQDATGASLTYDSGAIMKWNITDICYARPNAINWAYVNVYVSAIDGSPDDDLRGYYIRNQSVSDSLPYDELDDLNIYNVVTNSTAWAGSSVGSKHNLTVLTWVEQACARLENLTMYIYDPDYNPKPFLSKTTGGNTFKMGNTDTFGGDTTHEFSSSEHATASQRPQLCVQYKLNTSDLKIEHSYPVPDMIYNDTVGDVDFTCNVTSEVGIKEAYVTIYKHYGGWHVKEPWNVTKFTGEEIVDKFSDNMNFNLTVTPTLTNGWYSYECNATDYLDYFNETTGDMRYMTGKGEIYVLHSIHTEPHLESADFQTFRNTLQDNDLDQFEPITGRIVFDAMKQEWRDQYNDSNDKIITLQWKIRMSELQCESTEGCSAIVDKMLNNESYNYSGNITHYDDGKGWHYHHMDWYNWTEFENNDDGNADFNEEGTCVGRDCQYNGVQRWNQIITQRNETYRNQSDVQIAEKMLAIFVIDSDFYPIIEVSGWLWENTNMSNWLDNYIPFSDNSWWAYCNNAPGTCPISDEDGYPDEIENVIGWNETTPSEAYHPDSTDYNQPGSDAKANKRIQLPTVAGHSWELMNHSFWLADRGTDVIYSRYSHTYPPGITANVEDTHRCLNQSKWSYLGVCSGGSSMDVLYPEVKYIYEDDLAIAQGFMEKTDTTPPTIELWKDGIYAYFNSTESMWSNPILAIKNDTSYYVVIGEPTGVENEWRVDITGYNAQKLRAAGIDTSYNPGFSEIALTGPEISYPLSTDTVTVTANENLTVNFTEYQDGVTQRENVTVENITLFNSSDSYICTVIDNSLDNISTVWMQNCTTPDLQTGLYYNLSIWTNLTHQWDGTMLLNDTEIGAIYYSSPDTCTYSSGDWIMDCTDNCTTSSEVNLGGNDIIITGSYGFWNVNAPVINWGQIYVESTDVACWVMVGSGGSLL